MIWLPKVVGLTVTLITTPVVLALLRKWNVVDRATVRSSHSGTAIRGVGLSTLTGVIAGLLVGFSLVDGRSQQIILLVAIFALLAALVGAWEDVKGVPVSTRAALQIVIGTFVALSLGAASFVSIPWFVYVIALVFIAGYINVANFMDGVNGISAIHGIVSGSFYVLVGLLSETPWLVVIGGVLAGCFLAFLPWNLLRRGTFLGDTGSYLLGALISIAVVAGWLIGLHPVIALGPTIIYCVDTGGTLLSRLLRGETLHEPHRSHVYQRLTTLGLSHVSVSCIVGFFTVLVAGATLLLAYEDLTLTAVAYSLIVVISLTYWFLPMWLDRKQGVTDRREKQEVATYER
jgi:UDP-N-acetylmuramyl pentapeptide phosphotransferase/UDP-N-acetylglucosamine-1-phosphate transferase